MGRFAIVLLLLSLLIGCTAEKKQLPTTGESGPGDGLVQEIEKSVMYFYDGPRRVFRLDADFMRKTLDAGGKTLAYPVKLTLYDSLGRTGTSVLADSGTTDDRRESFVIWGRVLVRTEDQKVIKTEKLWWNRDSHRVQSDTLVQIETPQGDIMRGKGLDAAEDFSWWSIKKNVSGVFPNFRERVEGEDPFIGQGGQ